MKSKRVIKPKTLVVFVIALLGANANAVTIVYEDTFDNDGLATNTGIGGGLVARTINTSTFGDNGNLVDTAGGNNGNRGVISSINSFNLANGFTLEVHMVGGTLAILESFGLSTAQFATVGSLSASGTADQDPLRKEGWAGESAECNAYMIGVETGAQAAEGGLKFNNGLGAAGSVTNLAATAYANPGAGQPSPYLNQPMNTFVLTVTPNDQFSYTYNGGTPVTGEIVSGAGVFDLSQPLFFNL